MTSNTKTAADILLRSSFKSEINKREIKTILVRSISQKNEKASFSSRRKKVIGGTKILFYFSTNNYSKETLSGA